MQVGKKVVCVDDVFPEWARKLYRELPVKDEIYTVRAVRLGRSQLAVVREGHLVKNGASEASPTVALLLEELHNGDDPLGPTNNKGGTEMAFNSERFRELDETSESDALEETEIIPLYAGEPVRGRTEFAVVLDDSNYFRPATGGGCGAITTP